MFYVVEAAHNENGQLNNGAPGDQTGDEVRIRELLPKDQSFIWILRCPDGSKANAFAVDALDIARNNNVGYTQYSEDGNKYSARYGLWYAMHDIMVDGKKISFIKIARPCNTDCSQLVSCVLTNNGYQSGMYMSTSTEINVLTGLGFEKIKYSYSELKNGDILWKKGHTGIAVYADEIPPQPKPPVDDGSEDKEKDEVFTATFKSTSATKVWSTGAGPNSRRMPYIMIPKSFIGFTPNVICVQQQGEVLSLCQWMRDQSEGFLYVSNFENNASAGVAVGTKAGYFNPDADKLIIPVRFPEKDYLVRIYK